MNISGSLINIEYFRVINIDSFLPVLCPAYIAVQELHKELLYIHYITDFSSAIL